MKKLPPHNKKSHKKADSIQQENTYSKHTVNQPINRGEFNLSKKRHHHHKVIDLENARNEYKRPKLRDVVLLPRNTAQEAYVDYLTDRTKRIIFAVGPAGTGKSYLCVKRAIKAFISGEVERIVITRPAVSVDEKHGFLPGDLNQKMDPWVRPIYDILEEHFDVHTIKSMLEQRAIEICPLAYMRGRTFKNAYIIADETQNCTPEQMKMLLTRIGDGSYMTVTGDLKQHDRGFAVNGLKDFIERFYYKPFPDIAIAEFGVEHVERDPVVAKVLGLYGDE